MNFARTRNIAIAMLAVFLTSLGTWSFSALRISHELEHAAHGVHGVNIASDDHGAAHAHHDDDEDIANKAIPSDAEHKLLHAAGLLQPAPLPAFVWQLPIQAGIVLPQLIPPKVAHATPEAPFRPPRHLSS